MLYIALLLVVLRDIMESQGSNPKSRQLPSSLLPAAVSLQPLELDF